MILLTGATGTIGTPLLRRLTAAGEPVRCLVRDPRRLGPERVRVQIALGDLGEPGVVPQRDARRRHGRPPGRRDPRPAGRLDRGARRRRDAAAGAGGRARGREALHVLLGDRRVAALAGALLPREGARRAGRRGGRARDARSSRRRSSTRRATRGSPCSTGCRGCPWRRSRAPATRCTSRSGRTTSPTAWSARSRNSNGTRPLRAGGPRGAHLRRDREDGAARVRAPPPAAARAAAGRARGAEGGRGVRRPVRVRDLGRGRADGALDDDAEGNGGRRVARRQAAPDGCGAGAR